jgi:hypothetical protein
MACFRTMKSTNTGVPGQNVNVDYGSHSPFLLFFRWVLLSWLLGLHKLRFTVLSVIGKRVVNKNWRVTSFL